MGAFLRKSLERIPHLQTSAPEQPQKIPGTGGQGMGHGMGMKEAGILFPAGGKISGVNVIGTEPLCDTADGIKTVGMKVEAQAAENIDGELRAGEGFAHPDLQMQRGGHGGQVVV